ncbi:hypothetical protein [Desulfovibrio sp. TomC]|uniref:hypothetical protein n=1 Tax=Desulfovibrio sp. TomC TaxID=1562888 RepID=UPI0005736B60|nr:hypothetical protein [Desulfovibrio sp. TomC]KHK01084.1 hypothetical protein NY78_3465 [Desulfovibrio sp. TomC]
MPNGVFEGIPNRAQEIIANIANELRKSFNFEGYFAANTQREVIVPSHDPDKLSSLQPSGNAEESKQQDVIAEKKDGPRGSTGENTKESPCKPLFICLLIYSAIIALRRIFTGDAWSDSLGFEFSLFFLISICGYITIKYGKNIYFFVSGDSETFNKTDKFHDEITEKVYRRLLLRNAVLNEAESLALTYNAHNQSNSDYNAYLQQQGCTQQHMAAKTPKDPLQTSDTNPPHPPHEDKPTDQSGNSPIEHPGDAPFKTTCSKEIKAAEQQLNPSTRAYNLATTDLFVEKALAYLNRKAKTHNRQGFLLYTLGLIAVTTATYIAYTNAYGPLSKLPIPSNQTFTGEYIVISFVKNFTFYGLIITIAVYACRLGKSLLDQAERMKDRRHALRQGRLFVHLNGGKLSIDELDKAFNWNTSQENAFFHLNPEAQAPWGNMFKEMMITIRETAKSSMELTKALKKTD